MVRFRLRLYIAMNVLYGIQRGCLHGVILTMTLNPMQPHNFYKQESISVACIPSACINGTCCHSHL